MGRRSKIILGFLVAVLIGIIVTEIVRPRPLNWRPSYTAISKIPFGCYVLFNELPSIFPNSKIESVEESVYDVLINRDSSQLSNYIVINDFVSFDEQETNKLLSYVSAGNHVFIATNGLPGKLADTLNIEIEQHYDLQEDTISAYFTHQDLASIDFKFERGADPSYFTSIDTSNAKILGNIRFTENSYLANQSKEIKDLPNFIKTSFGKGSFLVNTLPVAFTNYYVLGKNKRYIEGNFSYLIDNPLYWDDYKKSGRVVINSPLRFILAQPALKWSYYLLIVGLLFFAFFKAKREQRIIPVIKPLENSSVEFARTVGSLYYQNRDFTNLNTKKINYFLTYLRNRFYVNTTVLDENLITQVAAKAGKTNEETKSLIGLLVSLQNKPVHTEQDTIHLTKKINAFKKSYGR